MESRTRRGLSGIVALCALVLAGGWFAAARASVGPIEQPGVFALLGGTPKIVSKFWAEHGAGLSATLKIRQFAMDGTTPILNYDVDMQRTIHLVVVSDDFSVFSHTHPDFNTTTGTFSQAFTKQPNHRYYVYADTVPHGVGQQVFRFTMESDGAAAKPNFSKTASALIVSAGPYAVSLNETTVAVDQPTPLNLTIVKGNGPAQDLGAYLGAAAHVIMVNTSSLAYVHVHAHPRNTSGKGQMGEMPMNGPVSPNLSVDLPALPAGVYKAWVQFRGANYKIYTAPFTILAQ